MGVTKLPKGSRLLRYFQVTKFPIVLLRTNEKQTNNNSSKFSSMHLATLTSDSKQTNMKQFIVLIAIQLCLCVCIVGADKFCPPGFEKVDRMRKNRCFYF